MTKFIYITDLKGVLTDWSVDELFIAKDDIVRAEKTEDRITVIQKSGDNITLQSKDKEKITDLWKTFLWELGG